MDAEQFARLEVNSRQESEIFLQRLKPALYAQCSDLRVGHQPVRISPSARDCLPQIIERDLQLAEPYLGGAGGIVYLADKALPNPRLRNLTNLHQQ
jgi:hypothetical protein